MDTVDKLYICKERMNAIQLNDRYMATAYETLEAVLKQVVI